MMEEQEERERLANILEAAPEYQSTINWYEFGKRLQHAAGLLRGDALAIDVILDEAAFLRVSVQALAISGALAAIDRLEKAAAALRSAPSGTRQRGMSEADAQRLVDEHSFAVGSLWNARRDTVGSAEYDKRGERLDAARAALLAALRSVPSESQQEAGQWTGPRPPMIDGFPRRSRLDHLVPAERAIYDAVQAVESLGADELLTRAVVLLQEARGLVADFVEDGYEGDLYSALFDPVPADQENS